MLKKLNDTDRPTVKKTNEYAKGGEKERKKEHRNEQINELENVGRIARRKEEKEKALEIFLLLGVMLSDVEVTSLSL